MVPQLETFYLEEDFILNKEESVEGFVLSLPTTSTFHASYKSEDVKAIWTVLIQESDITYLLLKYPNLIIKKVSNNK